MNRVPLTWLDFGISCMDLAIRFSHHSHIDLDLTRLMSAALPLLSNIFHEDTRVLANAFMSW